MSCESDAMKNVQYTTQDHFIPSQKLRTLGDDCKNVRDSYCLNNGNRIAQRMDSCDTVCD